MSWDKVTTPIFDEGDFEDGLEVFSAERHGKIERTKKIVKVPNKGKMALRLYFSFIFYSPIIEIIYQYSITELEKFN
ncbi:MAG: hypothetical protein JW984_10475 [Deltaproteobacteria bacterium]|uniref:Uncharacterized protein n=1 Tax=Candidatus Zymogenus saltonus TaxID=2844893 RepID=A0A9D8KF83_9DELT|nr:hypothetical protein [Candidatus Zymogenus saltonus]